ncbi:AMP-binding protein [Congregibacter sp.]|uniref:AMP-binding protein n=1 Tax=Congregibacter sp. TaxID=2744308 RepID=UPI003F6C4021
MLTESYVMGPTDPTVRNLTIGDALREAATECPEQLALIAGTPEPEQRRQWTYASLFEEAELTARALLANFEPGDRVAVWAPNIPEWIIMEYGCALAGIVLVTVNPSYQSEELAYVLRQSRASGIFLLPEFRGNPMEKHLEAARGGCPDLKKVVLFTEWQAFLATAENHVLPVVKPVDACMIQYTSGTTGFPKGALLHHRGLVNNGAHTMTTMGAVDGGTYMGIMPLFHTGGCVLAVLGALSKRSALVLVEAFEPGLVLALMEEYRAAAMLGVPTMLIAMVEHPSFPERDLSSVKALCSGGSTVPADLVRRLEDAVGAPFTIVFGQTECSPVACMTHPDDTIEDKAHTLGQAMPGVELKVVDPETGVTQPVGVLGEFCTRGYHVMHEYFENPEATAKTIDADGWLHTGDLCSMDERGYCKIEGRLKDMIIRGGENIYPREIEELLFQHPTVGEVAVVGLPSKRLGEEVGVFLRPAPDASLSRDALFAYLREHLSPQKTPKYWYEVESYPMTGSGKIQKFELRKSWENGEHSEMPAGS